MSEDQSTGDEDQSFGDVATEIALWQGTALQLPLDEVQDVASRLLNHLGCILNEFNQVYLDEQRAEDALAAAVAEVTRQATAAAIFTLGASQRTWQEAALN